MCQPFVHLERTGLADALPVFDRCYGWRSRPARRHGL